MFRSRKISRTAILTTVTSLWSDSGRNHSETSNLWKKAEVSCMSFCISFFDFIPVDVRNRRVCQG